MQLRFMMIINLCRCMCRTLCHYCQVCEQQHICVRCPASASPLLMMGLYLLLQYLSLPTSSNLTPQNSYSNLLISHLKALDCESQKGHHLQFPIIHNTGTVDSMVCIALQWQCLVTQSTYNIAYIVCMFVPLIQIRCLSTSADVL